MASVFLAPPGHGTEGLTPSGLALPGSVQEAMTFVDLLIDSALVHQIHQALAAVDERGQHDG